MTHDQLRDTYSHRIEQFRTAAKHHVRLMNYIAMFRLASLILMVWLIVYAIKNNQPLYHGAAAILAVVFLFLVSRFNKQKDLRNLNTRMMESNQQEAACLEHRFSTLPDGMEYADASHPWSHDLDLFGKGSLFQYLNRTVTRKGSTLLAGILTTEPESQEAITERQGINANLRDKIDFRQIFTARGSLVKEKDDDLPGILRWLSASAYIVQHRWLFFLALGVSLTAMGIIIAGILNPGAFWYLLPLLLFNSMLLSPFLLRTKRYQETISRKHELLEGYARLLEIIAANNFDNPVLQGNRERAREGMKELARLSRLLGFFDQRLNMLLGSIFNGLFLFDFIMMHLLESWKSRNSEKIMAWIEVVGWTDAMISLSGFAYNHPDFVIPEMKEEVKSMELHDLGHPLIPPVKRVVNHLTIEDEKIVIITGANMAGKSTFLRSLGVNMVLAYAGCPVCASRFNTRFMGLCSSMRTADSLADEESYFLAEIKKLQRIVKRMETGCPLLILLDEVLKGTNTTDKKRGSVGLIKRSLNYPVRCFIATHDLSLGALEKELPGQVVNYCFESYIKELELEFDYSIRKGIAANMNASFLMKKMGIMD